MGVLVNEFSPTTPPLPEDSTNTSRCQSCATVFCDGCWHEGCLCLVVDDPQPLIDPLPEPLLPGESGPSESDDSSDDVTEVADTEAEEEWYDMKRRALESDSSDEDAI